MKSIKYLFFCALIAVLAVSCKKGLDPINQVDPGPDLLPPVVLIADPVDGKMVISADSVGPITLKFSATDDIELKSVTVTLDGTVIGSYTSFTDYRRFAPNLVYPELRDGNHVLTVTAVDQTDKTDSKTSNFRKVTAPPYDPMAGEVVYVPFDGSYLNYIGYNEVGVVGSPAFAPGKKNDAYAGATNAYITYPTAGIVGDEFSFAFWIKVNSTPLRAGVFVIGRDGGTGTDEDRKFGFRVFREGTVTSQNVGLNMGIGTTDVWKNPFVVLPVNDDWVHIAIAFSPTLASIYVNGDTVSTVKLLTPIDWTGCSTISIASGAPNFTVWEHFSDLSLYDEVHLFTRAITREDVQTLYNVKKK
jgi:hypothetical protein